LSERDDPLETVNATRSTLPVAQQALDLAA